MKLLRIVVHLLLVALCFSFSKPTDLPVPFKKLLERNKMNYIAPEGFTEVPIQPNNQMEYDYAIKHKKVNLEIRYSIRPLDTEITEYKKWLKKKPEGSVMLDPDNIYETLLSTTVLNISGEELPKIQAFPKEAVKSEFNASWGATTITTVKGEFAQNYKYSIVVALNKKGVGNAYIFFMSDDGQVITDHFEEAFHTLKFK